MTSFSEAVVAGVTGHMNGDHSDDNLLIARAFGRPEATASTMVGVTSEGGVWSVTDAAGTSELEVAWPAGAISERPEIRREVVKLYRAACERLGVPAREEHAPSADGGDASHGGAPHGHGAHSHAGDAHGAHPHGAHPHGAHPHGAHPHGRHAAADADADADAAAADGEKPFSAVIRESSWSDHSDSEGASFMEDIMRGNGTREDYIDLVAQHYFMYVALEAAAARVLADPAHAPFHPETLVRLPALEADLEHLLGADWREQISAVPATEAYAARIAEVAEENWAAGVIAHHYTRYLGDLSGGQMIAKRVAKQHDLPEAGIAFYDFSDLGSIPAFKAAYREQLDALGERLDEAERERMLDEVRTAYHFNTAVFVDLGKRKRELAGA